MGKHMSKRVLAVLLSLAMLLGAMPSAFAADSGSAGEQGFSWKKVDSSAVTAALDQEVVEEPEETPLYEDTENVRVSIILEEEPTVALFSVGEIDENRAAVSYRASLEAKQKWMSNTISQQALNGSKLDVVWNLTLAANIISANVEYGQIEAIKEIDGVVDVVLEKRYSPDVVSIGEHNPDMEISTDMTGTNVAWTNGYTGAGMRVAIIDTGLDTDHQSFDSEAFVHALEEDAAEAGMTYAQFVEKKDLLDEAEIADKLAQLNAYKKTLDGNGQPTAATPTAENLYRSEKVAFGYNYVDRGLDITHDHDTQGEHGSHVAGISIANRYLKQGDAYVSAKDTVHMVGNAPDAQIIVMKVFGKGGGAYDSDYMAAIEDAIVLGCDTVNLSLGSGNPGMTFSDEYQDIMDSLSATNTLAVMSAGNSGTWAENSYNMTGLPYGDDVVFHTGGSPGTFTNSLGVASVDNNGMIGAGFQVGGQTVVYTETTGYMNEPMASLDTSGDMSGTEYDYVLITGIGNTEDYAGIDLTGKVVFCYRGEISFYVKGDNAAELGAAAVVVCNNQPGSISMDLSDYSHTAPVVSITQAEGEMIQAASTEETSSEGVTYYTGKLTVSGKATVSMGSDDYLTMSSFSSWGVPGDLSMKPEITAPGGSIYSVNGAVSATDQYELMSGTSMAAPQVAGIGALVKQYIEENGFSQSGLTDRALTQSLLMSTATPLKDADGNYYSVLRQGAGLANTAAATSADSYVLVNGQEDGKVKVELGDDPARKGVYDVSFSIHNLDGKEHTYTLDADMFTQNLIYYYANSQGSATAFYLDTATMALNAKVEWTVNGSPVVPSSQMADLDFDGDGDVDIDDGQALLDYVTGVRASISNKENADFNGDGSITTYDAHLFFQYFDVGKVNVPANSSVQIHGTITLDAAEMAELMEYCPNGVYVEGFVKVDCVSTLEGELGTSHTIPVLGFYGNWTDASMFDRGSYLEYAYGEEVCDPYLGNMKDNVFTVKYAGDSSAYYYAGNPLVDEDQYLPERNALNNQVGDVIYSLNCSPIRNAAASKIAITSADGGTPYVEQELGQVMGAYYYSNGGAWKNTATNLRLNWAGTDGNGNPLPENTTVKIALTLAPELYVNDDGSVNWAALGEGATLSTLVTIDNTDPELVAVEHDKAAKQLSVTAKDNQYVAAVALLTADGSKLVAAGTPNQTEKGVESVTTLDLGDVLGKNFLLAVYDYAMNLSVYEVSYDLRPDIDGYYTAYDWVDAMNWLTYTRDGSSHATAGYGEPLFYCGAYAGGYVFAYDIDNNFYVMPEDDLGSRTLIKSGEEFSDCYYTSDMAYDKVTGTMYLLYQDTGWNATTLATVDLMTGDVTKICNTDPELYLIAVADDGTIYGVGFIDGSLYKVTVGGSSVTVEKVGTPAVSAANQPSSLTWDSNANELVLAGNSYDFNMNFTGCTVYGIDPTNGTAEKKFDSAASMVCLFTPPVDGEAKLPAASHATSVKMSSGELTMLLGTTAKLSASVQPWNLENKSVTWSSSNPSVAVVANGTVYAVGKGQCVITAASAADPTVSAQCQVTVTSVSADLNALVWDENGAVWWSTFNTEALAAYNKQVESQEHLASATMSGTGAMYGVTLDTDEFTSTLYAVDPATLTATEIGPIQQQGLELALMDMAYAPNLNPNGTGYILGVYANYIVMVDPATGGIVGAWDYGEGNTLMVGIAYAGSVYNSYYGKMIDTYAIIDVNGNVYYDAFMGLDGKYYYFNGMEDGLLGSTGFDTAGTPYFNSACYTEDDSGTPYLFWSQYAGGDAVQMIAIDIDSTGAAYNLGEFPADVWPVGGLMSGSIPALATSAQAAKLANAVAAPVDATAAVAPVLAGVPNAKQPVPQAPVEEPVPAEDPVEEVLPEEPVVDEVLPEEPVDEETLPQEPVVDGSLNAVRPVTGSGDVVGPVIPGATGTATVKLISDSVTTNGLLKISYDPNVLTFVGASGNTTLTSYIEKSKGEITYGYACMSAVPAESVLGELKFIIAPTIFNTEITVTTVEDGAAKPGDVSSVTITGNGGIIVKPTTPTTPTTPTVPTVPGDQSHEDTCPGKQFLDLSSSAWYHEYTDYVIGEGLMKGVSSTQFDPNGQLTRAMLVKILYRLENEPAVSAQNVFSDVASGVWYTNAVNWAAEKGIVTGYGNGSFGPNDYITRQELAKILWQYAQYKGYDVGANGAVMPDFVDRDEIASWAAEAMSWAYSRGIITGNNNRLAPRGQATRAETAAMLYRFSNLSKANETI